MNKLIKIIIKSLNENPETWWVEGERGYFQHIFCLLCNNVKITFKTKDNDSIYVENIQVQHKNTWISVPVSMWNSIKLVRNYHHWLGRLGQEKLKKDPNMLSRDSLVELAVSYINEHSALVLTSDNKEIREFAENYLKDKNAVSIN